jgi:hypothetical protein
MRWLAFSVLFLTACAPQTVVKKPPPEIFRAQSADWLKAIGKTAVAGDWFVVRGYKKVDNLVVMATNMPLSHTAIYDPENNQVIEATGKGVNTLGLKKFVNKSHRLLIIRPRWWTAERGQQALQWARAAVGKKYDFLGTLGLNRSNRYYCSELCIDAYQKYHESKDHIPKIVEPGQMYLWGLVLFDSGSRN